MTAKIWDAKTGQELFTLTGHDDVVRSVAYSADGRRIVTAGGDGTVQIYTTDMGELLEIAKSRVTRQLTSEEKEEVWGTVLVVAFSLKPGQKITRVRGN